jgi:hypothetical protein
MESEDTNENRLRLKILDFFIDRNISDDVFEEVLTIRINDRTRTNNRVKISVKKYWKHGNHGILLNIN